MDYIKMLRALCNCDNNFNHFMHKPTKGNFSEFVVNSCDEYDDFALVFEEKEITIHCAHGATKACLVIEDELSVIKIGFSDFFVNHAEREYNVYREAVCASVDKYFVPCQYIGEIFENPVFTMNFVEVDETRVTSDLWTRCRESMSAEEISDIIDYEDGFVEALFPFYYGDEVIELYEFLNSLEINDLHGGNIGYDEDGNIKLVDYSGYFPYYLR